MRNAIALSFAVAACLMMVFPATASELTITVSDSSVVESTLQLDFAEWIRHPVDPTGCESGDCCPNATDAQCTALAKSFGPNPKFWVRSIYACIQADIAWRCHREVLPTGEIMYCEVVPATASVRLGDLAGCASEQAAVHF